MKKKEWKRRWCFLAPSQANVTNNPQHMAYHENGMFRQNKMENVFFSLLPKTNKRCSANVSLEELSWWYISWICVQLVVCGSADHSAAAVWPSWRKNAAVWPRRLCSTTFCCMVRAADSSSIDCKPARKMHTCVHTPRGECCSWPAR